MQIVVSGNSGILRKTQMTRFHLYIIYIFIIYSFIHSFLYYPFSEINRLWHDNQSVDDFLLLTSFPQRRISEMESTLEAEGNWNQLPKSSFGIESVRIILSHIK